MFLPRKTFGPIALLPGPAALGTPEFSPSMDYFVGDHVSLCWSGRGRQLVSGRVRDRSTDGLLIELCEDLCSHGSDESSGRAGDVVQVTEAEVWFVELCREA